MIRAVVGQITDDFTLALFRDWAALWRYLRSENFVYVRGTNSFVGGHRLDLCCGAALADASI